jgi:cbb3-type cytochrome oxidase maturation protein
MDDWVMVMMLGASLLLGSIALFAFIWAVKDGQFDDETKMMNAVHYDDEKELNDAADLERKKKQALEKNYRPE